MHSSQAPDVDVIQPSAVLWGAIVGRVLDFTRVTPIAFAAPGKGNGLVAWARALAAYIAHCEFEIEQAEISRLARLSEVTIRKGVEDVEDRREDPALEAAIEVMSDDVRRWWITPAELAAANMRQHLAVM